MQPTEGDRFRNLLRGMGRMYGQEPDALVLDAYWIALRDWEFSDFQAAAAHLMATAQFMPRPAEFNALRRAGEPTPAEAWSVALPGCKHWRTPEQLPNGRIARAAAAVGGFRAIAMSDVESDLPHVQRRFLDAYEELTDVEATREAVPQIAPTPQPLRIGGGFERLTGPEIKR